MPWQKIARQQPALACGNHWPSVGFCWQRQHAGGSDRTAFAWAVERGCCGSRDARPLCRPSNLCPTVSARRAGAGAAGRWLRFRASFRFRVQASLSRKFSRRAEFPAGWSNPYRQSHDQRFAAHIPWCWRPGCRRLARGLSESAARGGAVSRPRASHGVRSGQALRVGTTRAPGNGRGRKNNSKDCAAGIVIPGKRKPHGRRRLRTGVAKSTRRRGSF